MEKVDVLAISSFDVVEKNITSTSTSTTTTAATTTPTTTATATATTTATATATTTTTTTIIIIELTHSKTILENTVKIEPQPIALDFKDLSQYSSRSK